MAVRRPRRLGAAARDQRAVVVVVVVVAEVELRRSSSRTSSRLVLDVVLVGVVGVLLGAEARSRFFGAEDAHTLDGRTFVVVQIAHVFLTSRVLT